MFPVFEKSYIVSFVFYKGAKNVPAWGCFFFSKNVISFSWEYSRMKDYIVICYVAQTSYLEKFFFLNI